MVFPKSSLLAFSLVLGLFVSIVIINPSTFSSLKNLATVATSAGSLSNLTVVDLTANTWTQVTSHTVTWQTTGTVANIDLFICLQTGGCITTQKQNYPNTGSASLYIGHNVPAGTQAFIKIRPTGGAVFSLSPLFTVISDTPTVSITSVIPATSAPVTTLTVTPTTVTSTSSPIDKTTITPSTKSNPSTPIPIVIPEFTTKYMNWYNPPQYSFLGEPIVIWTGLTGPADTTCSLGSNPSPGGLEETNFWFDHRFLVKDKPTGSAIITLSPDKLRVITLQCSSASTGQNISKTSIIPANTLIDGQVGTSNIPLTIDSFTITPANRERGVSGSITWQATCPLQGLATCTCELDQGMGSYGVTTTKIVLKNQGIITTGQATTSINGGPGAIDPVSSAKHTLVCVTNDGGKRIVKSIVDSVKTSTTTSPSIPVPTVGFPTITSFTITPSNRVYDTQAKFSWTSINTDYCQLSTQGSLHMAPNSKDANVTRLTIPALDIQPKSTVTTAYTLTCFKTVSTNPSAANSSQATIRLTTGPGSIPQFTNGASALNSIADDTNPNSPTFDPYTQYNLSAPIAGEHQLQARVAGKVPVFSDGKLVPTLADAPTSLWSDFFAKLTTPFAEASGSLVVNILGQTSAIRPNVTLPPVPFWSKVKFQWQFAPETALNGAYTVTYGGTYYNPNQIPACEYLNIRTNECIKYGLDPVGCLAGSVPGDPRAYFTDRTHGQVPLNVAPDPGHVLYPGGSTWPPHCESHPGGDYEWTPTPEDPIRGVVINGATHQTGPFVHWFNSPTDNQALIRSVTVTGQKCEKSFSDITGSLQGSATDITEETFRDWAKDDAFDHFANCTDPNRKDPLKCNSGDLGDIKNYLLTGQCTTISQPSASGFLNSVTVESYAKPYLDKGFPVPLYYVKTAFNSQGGVSLTGNHAVVALSMSSSGSGSSATYSFSILDPNGPTLDTISCDTKQVQFSPGVFTKILACQSGKLYQGEWMILLNPTFVQSAVNVNTLIANRVRNDVSAWLSSNYPQINNSEAWSNGGVCAAWSNFVLRVAYLGNFVDECPRPAGQ